MVCALLQHNAYRLIWWQAPSHYLNQCWLIVNGFLSHSSETNFTGRAQDINSWNRLEKYTGKTTSTSPRCLWVNSLRLSNACMRQWTNHHWVWLWLGTNHYLNQWCNIVNTNLRNKFQWYLYWNSYIFTQGNALNMLSGKWRPFYLGLNVSMPCMQCYTYHVDEAINGSLCVTDTFHPGIMGGLACYTLTGIGS